MSPEKPKKPEIIDVGGGGMDFGNFHPPYKLVGLGVVALILILWFALGGPMYTVEPDEVGVVLTFGKYAHSAQAGLHFKMPWPVQTVEKVKVAQVNRLEIGFRSQQIGGRLVYKDFTEDKGLLAEAQMLTGDENVVNVSLAVQYRIKNEVNYLFNFDRGEVDKALRDIAEACLRQAVGDHPIDAVLTEGKSIIRTEIQQKMQDLADKYGMGVQITEVQLQDVKPPDPVKDAFQGVASAREEREQLINEARAYQSEQVPKAEGEVEKIRLEAEAYKESQVAEATGDVSRFQAIVKQFEAAPDVTRDRLYLEAMDELLPKVHVTVIDKDANLLNLKSLDAHSAPILTPEKPKGESQ